MGRFLGPIWDLLEHLCPFRSCECEGCGGHGGHGRHGGFLGLLGQVVGIVKDRDCGLLSCPI